ncbi:MAG: hypothetical protein A2V70_05455 [Planctomycetes bacterium RBG_13_63_9]|nr:MAG: hypothetical protein A2V70_05455 [Planctomycetes bacterium RBG_13_63_9]
MTPAEFRASGLHRLSAAEMRALNAWFNKTIKKAVAIGRDSRPAKSPVGAITLEDIIKDIMNGTIIAADGQFLGTISANRVDPKSISNQVGMYGGAVGRFSIFSKVGRYGGEIGQYSPFNKITAKPPQIFIDDKPVCYLTVNRLKSPRFDPHALKAWVESRR